MRPARKFVLVFLLLAACSHTRPEPDVGQTLLPLDIRWVRETVEYVAICEQVYRMGWQAVKAAAAQQTGDWVVVLDVDETVLDNSMYQVEISRRGEPFTAASWDKWVWREEATPVPGAKAFLDSVRSLGPRAHIAFITNREATQEAPTIRNLQAYGLWRDGDVILCRRDRSDSKEIRRQEVRQGTGRCEGLGPRQIVALFGDQLFDMEERPAGLSVPELIRHYSGKDEWGTRYFMLPNPMYGYWERGY